MGPPVGGGERVPSFQVTTLEGREYGTEALEGRVKVITFWATWCRVCHFELPAVQRVHEAWGGGEEVVVLGLSIDGGGKAVVRAHLEERGFTFPVAMADRGTRRAFGGIPGVPTTFIVDRQGIVRHTLVGVSGPGTLRRAVRRLVEEPPSPGGRVGVPPGEGSVP
jgi:cytochrome c biogenesis protein CcmG, thiol:disulfide interchange protein DsbE